MSVWVALPSIRPVDQVEPILQQWQQRGYKIAVLREGEPISKSLVDIQIMSKPLYPGWTTTVNALAGLVLDYDSEARWVVAGGDDLLPEPHRTAHHISEMLCETFSHYLTSFIGSAPTRVIGHTHGVMQPTGDRYITPGSILPYPDVEHSACSPWIGREFCERAYGGNGPMWEGYRHYWGDNELQEVAKKLGCFWQRPDLTQLHRHWSREPNAACPEHLRAAHEGGAEVDRLLFEERKAAGFPGHELSPC